MNDSTSTKIKLAGAGCGLLFTTTFFVALIPFAHFWPPPEPSASAEVIQQMYLNNLFGIRAGMIICGLSCTLLAAFGGTLTAQVRKCEEGTPALTYMQVACVAASLTLGFLSMLVWSVAAFRPDAVSPEMTLTLNDLGWFLFFWTWPPFSLWQIGLAVAILRDHSGDGDFPRWSGYFSIFTAIAYLPASMIVFFKVGPLAFNGLIACWLTVVAYFVWVTVISVLLIRAIRREGARKHAVSAFAPAPDDGPRPTISMSGRESSVAGG